MAKVTLDKGSDWEKAAAALALTEKLDEIAQKAVLQEAHFFRKKMIEGFTNEGPEGTKWAPLSPLTLAVRQFLGFSGTKILQVTGDLRNSISVVPITGGGAFVGVSRNVSRKDGQDPVNLALEHEQGRTYRVTMNAKSRRFLFAAIAKAGLQRPAAPRSPGKSGGGPVTITVRIPARPFIGPVVERYGAPEAVQASVAARMARMLGGALGSPGTTPRE